MSVQAQHVPPRASDKRDLKISGASFAVQSGGKLKLEKSNFNRPGIDAIIDMSEVIASLYQLPEPDFTWLDLCIGVVVPSGMHGQSVWSQYLRFWRERDWLRSAVSGGRK